MNKKILSGFMFLLLAVSLVINVPGVYACSCVVPQPPKESMEAAKAVFAGRVTAMSGPVDGPIMSGSSADPVEVTFQVSRVWKGVSKETVILSTAQASASCGYNFEKGKEYLVYAYDVDGKLGTGLCTRTALLADAKEDIAELGAGNVIEGGAKQNDFDYGSFIVPGVLLLAAGLIAYKFLSAKKAS